MPGCYLNYIPDRLHWNNRPVITEFAVGDIIYRRCFPEELDNPYATISLADLSHNIGTNAEVVISYEKDVLLSIRPDEEFENYEDKITCTLVIKSLNPNNCYNKPFGPVKKGNVDYQATMEFIHNPDTCMYPHSVFRIIMNGSEVTMDNYKQTLGNKSLSKLRTLIRDEIASMIRRRVIEQVLS